MAAFSHFLSPLLEIDFLGFGNFAVIQLNFVFSAMNFAGYYNHKEEDFDEIVLSS